MSDFFVKYQNSMTKTFVKNKLDEKLYKYLDKDDSIDIKSLTIEIENVIKRNIPNVKVNIEPIDDNKFNVTIEGIKL